MFALSNLVRIGGRSSIISSAIITTANNNNAAAAAAALRAMGTMSGKVKWFDAKKGFGFISPDDEDDGDDVFVHQSVIHAEGFRSLADGEPVEYDTVVDSNSGKIKATNVTGPLGAYVQGAPRRSFDSQFRDSSVGGYGTSRGGGFSRGGGGYNNNRRGGNSFSNNNFNFDSDNEEEMSFSRNDNNNNQRRPSSNNRRGNNNDLVTRSGSYSLFDDNDDETNNFRSRVSGSDVENWIEETSTDSSGYIDPKETTDKSANDSEDVEVQGEIKKG